MQKTLKKARPLARIRRRVRQYWALHPRLYAAIRAGTAGAAAFGMSGASLLGRPLPLCLAFLSAMPSGIVSASAFCGTALGTLVFAGMENGLTVLASGLLIAVESLLFRTLLPREKHWFMPVSAACFFGLLSFFPLLQAGFPPRDTAYCIFCMLAVCGASFLFGRSSAARTVLLLSALLSTAVGISLLGDLSLGVILASGVCCLFLSAPNGLPVAAALGLMLDFSRTEPTALCAVFLAAAVFCALPIRLGKWLKVLVFCASCTAFTLFVQTVFVSDYVAMLLGAILSLALPSSLAARFSPKAVEESAIMSALSRAAQVFSQMGTLLTPQIQTKSVTPAEIFDTVADDLCRNCEKWKECWQKNAKDTYLALSSAAAKFLPRGRCEKDDFPPFFLERCQKQTEFLYACSELLLNFRKNRQYSSRLSETKSVLSGQYRSISRTLSAFSEPKPPLSPPCYRAEVGYRALGVRASRISGDFGIHFEFSGKFYLLLCDGMGTGLLASEQAEAAAGLLRQMILAGFLPKDAIETLSGVYFLRENAAFSTVDLLEVDLLTADGTLFKCGAAPSYLKLGRRVVRLGGGTLPPGCGDMAGCEEIRVTLGGGAVLVLTSDGLDASKTEELLLSSRKTDLSELASELVSRAGSRLDDCSAALVRFFSLPHT